MSSTIISAGLKSRVRLNESTIPDEVFKLSANTEHYRYIFLEKNKYLKQLIFMCLISLMQFEVLFLGLFSTEVFYIFKVFYQNAPCISCMPKSLGCSHIRNIVLSNKYLQFVLKKHIIEL